MRELPLLAPNFLTVLNVTTLLKGASLTATVAIGFTLIFILGQLDLSIGAVVMLSGMLVIGLQPQWGWPGSMVAAIAALMWLPSPIPVSPPIFRLSSWP